MTLEDLDALYDRANHLILARSAAATGKALIFTASNLDDAANAIADLYALTEDERATLTPHGGTRALAAIQQTTTALAGHRRIDATRAVSIARSAIDGGRTIRTIAALAKAGPKAAEAAAASGKVAGRASIWGWVATAAYAVGTGAWFAYNLRAFNRAAYELRRMREGIEAPPARASLQDMAAARLSAAARIAGAGAKAAGDGAAVAMHEAARHGTSLAGKAGDLLHRARVRQHATVEQPDAEPAAPEGKTPAG